MNLQSIRSIAREVGIKPGKLTKATLIKNIQRKEGNFDCFATARSGVCDQQGCLWRSDCFSSAKKAAH